MKNRLRPDFPLCRPTGRQGRSVFSVNASPTVTYAALIRYSHCVTTWLTRCLSQLMFTIFTRQGQAGKAPQWDWGVEPLPLTLSLLKLWLLIEWQTWPPPLLTVGTSLIPLLACRSLPPEMFSTAALSVHYNAVFYDLCQIYITVFITPYIYI